MTVANYDMTAYLELLLGLEDFGQGFTSSNTQGVSDKDNLLNMVVGLEVGDVLVHVGSRVEFQGLALERKYVCHGDCLGRTD